MRSAGSERLGRSDDQDWRVKATQAHWRVTELAGRCSVTIRSLERLFLKRFGLSPRATINEWRLEEAIRLLEAGVPIKVVAIELCYRDAPHFCNAFRKARGLTPLAFVSFRKTAPSGGGAQPSIKP